MLYSAADISQCPEGQEVPQDQCLAAANALTEVWTTVANRGDLLVNDWSGLPCGCFIYNSQMIDYDSNCANAFPSGSAQLVCRHPDTITSAPTTGPTPWSPPPPVGYPAARSYDSHEWESVYPINLYTFCDEAGCFAQLPAENCNGIYYVLEEYLAADPITPEQEAAKLLEQATFGATQASIDLMTSTNAHDWIADQMNESVTPASLHRVHYRQRSNSHVRQTIDRFSLRDACKQGSRWNRWAFNRYRDIGKLIQLDPTNIGTVRTIS